MNVDQLEVVWVLNSKHVPRTEPLQDWYLHNDLNPLVDSWVPGHTPGLENRRVQMESRHIRDIGFFSL